MGIENYANFSKMPSTFQAKPHCIERRRLPKTLWKLNDRTLQHQICPTIFADRNYAMKMIEVTLVMVALKLT